MDPLSALRQELKVWVGVDVQDVDELGLEEGADVHPLLVDLLDSGWGRGQCGFLGLGLVKNVPNFAKKKKL